MISLTDDVVIHQQPTVGTTSSLPLQIIIDTSNDPDHPVFEVSNPNGSPAMSIDGNGQVSAANVYASNLGTASALSSDTDTTLAANSDSRIATQKATKVYADTKAPIASPTLTGVPAAPTAAVDTNTTQLSTTAFVIAQLSASGDGVPAIDGTAARGTSTHGARADHVHPTDTTRAPLASPGLTGTPTAPTAAVDTNTTQIATTAMVLAQAASATPVMNGAAAVGTSTRYARADHVHPVDTSRLAVASNLSDLASASTARTNLGLNTITDGAGALMLKSMGFLSVVIDITNNGGVMQHLIYDAAGSASASNFAGPITGASSATANTPSVNSVTGFTSGAGIDASGTNRFVLNTGTFVNADTAVKAQIEFNSTASNIRVQIRPISLNINGTTKNRLALGFTLEAGGGAFNLNTTNIAAGQIVRVRLFGFCPS